MDYLIFSIQVVSIVNLVVVGSSALEEEKLGLFWTYCFLIVLCTLGANLSFHKIF